MLKERVKDEIKDRLLDDLLGDKKQRPADGESAVAEDEEKDVEDQLKDEARRRLKDLFD